MASTPRSADFAMFWLLYLLNTMAPKVLVQVMTLLDCFRRNDSNQAARLLVKDQYAYLPLLAMFNHHELLHFYQQAIPIVENTLYDKVIAGHVKLILLKHSILQANLHFLRILFQDDAFHRFILTPKRTQPSAYATYLYEKSGHYEYLTSSEKDTIIDFLAKYCDMRLPKRRVVASSDVPNTSSPSGFPSAPSLLSTSASSCSSMDTSRSLYDAHLLPTIQPTLPPAPSFEPTGSSLSSMGTSCDAHFPDSVHLTLPSVPSFFVAATAVTTYQPSSEPKRDMTPSLEGTLVHEHSLFSASSSSSSPNRSSSQRCNLLDSPLRQINRPQTPTR